MQSWNGRIAACLAVFALIFVTGCQQKDLAGEYAQDRLDCANLMSLHSWYHSAFMNNVEVDTIWAQKAKDVLSPVQKVGYRIHLLIRMRRFYRGVQVMIF